MTLEDRESWLAASVPVDDAAMDGWLEKNRTSQAELSRLVAGYDGSGGSAGSFETVRRTVDLTVLDVVCEWLRRFVCTVEDWDLDILALWAVHTHLAEDLYTTPRLMLDSSVPGSGKTTVLEHLERICHHPVQMASLSSPALLTRMLDAGMRTILIDEVDRSLDPKKDGVPELLAVLNSGYKRGGTRPVLIPVKGGGWEAKEMPTFSPVAMAGNNPNLPDDTRSRAIRVLLMPDIDGVAEESDWELIDKDARELGTILSKWAAEVRDEIRNGERPPLPDIVKGRARERWLPLKRVAAAVGGRWPAAVDYLSVTDVNRVEAEREEGIVQERPAIELLRHLREVWIDGASFVPTDVLIQRLVSTHPEAWGQFSPYGKTLTSQRMGRMLVTSYNVHSGRQTINGSEVRGYTLGSLSTAFRRFGMTLPNEPAKPPTTPQPAA